MGFSCLMHWLSKVLQFFGPLWNLVFRDGLFLLRALAWHGSSWLRFAGALRRNKTLKAVVHANIVFGCIVCIYW